MRLTNKDYWDSMYSGKTAFFDNKDHSISYFLNQYLKNGDSKESLEIGSFPGAFQPTIARNGYKLNGIDFNEGNSKELPNWLKSLNIDIGKFHTYDFFLFIKDFETKYDLVCSFGFIEHFKNYEEVLKLHCNLVKPGGQLVLTTPNFRGWMQFIPHFLVDRQNLSKHYLPSMNPDKWRHILETNGFDVEYSGYFGGYSFWIDKRADKGTFMYVFQRFVEGAISQLKKIFSILNFESSSFSCFCGVVATKRIY